MSRQCVFCGENVKSGKKLCDECEGLRRLKYCRDITVFERVRARYNQKHCLRLSYGQFVLLTKRIDERRRRCDKKRKKADT